MMPESTCRHSVLRRAVVFGSAAVLSGAGCTSNVQVGPAAIAGQRPDGTVEMRMVQAAYIGSGSAGRGTLYYRGWSHPFSVGGAGIGGCGVSQVEAHGDVFGLSDIAMFPGAYGQARYGYALGDNSAGQLW